MNNPITFETKAECVEFLKRFPNIEQLSNGNFYQTGTYCLKHGEYSQAEFKPVKYKEGWGIKKIHFYYAGTLNAPKDGHVDAFEDDFGNVCFELVKDY